MLLSSYSKGLIEAGCDEAGRGCLAGPVFASAVILPSGFRDSRITDSKKLSEKQRSLLRPVIESTAVSWAVASVDSNTIDQINILNASILAMHLAIAKLRAEPRLLLIDGNRFHPYPGIPHQCIVKGDATYLSIAAASILAKTHRDEYMQLIHTEHPGYGWDKNKGYPTSYHRTAIKVNGITPYHRLTFLK
jgi:ribonuclease HII